MLGAQSRVNELPLVHEGTCVTPKRAQIGVVVATIAIAWVIRYGVSASAAWAWLLGVAFIIVIGARLSARGARRRQSDRHRKSENGTGQS